MDEHMAAAYEPDHPAAVDSANSRLTIWCEEGKHDECKGWGETIFTIPRKRVECSCSCHAGRP